ncbi:universal stress protein [Spirulina major CS-329]|jgi:nucleotide-binding universal stress UspA family protein|uniref:universal stress protein n=1 Tax=Spirulina TaxID=1154 RepID=UPI00232F9C1E|nr:MULTISPECIES: universal stress protein [Spirulina]MDB9496391.1 universal stress protein [Spirulina subsalsa CS-330]MDB9504710.1 universal stress protein [Spirulina major CS-329]
MTLFTTNNVLVPIDFSEEAYTTLTETLEFVGDPAKLHILHVLTSLEPTEPGVVWQTVDNQARMEKVKKTFYDRFPDESYKQMKFSVVIGSPSSEIIDYAQKNAIELIVISASGRTGVSQFFLGSVAERVVRHAKCPVLVNRG